MSIEHPRLFGAGKRKKPPPDPWAKATGTLVALFVRLYRTRCGEPPLLDKRDPATLRRKLVLCAGTYGPDALAKVAERLTFYMQTDDEYVRTHGGYTIRNFELRWNAIVNLLQVSSASRAFTCHHQPPCLSPAAHTRTIIDAQRANLSSPPSPSRPSDVF